MQYCSYGTFSSSVLWWVGVLIIKSGLTPSSRKLTLTRLIVVWTTAFQQIKPSKVVGASTTLGDGHTAQQLVELLVVADGDQDVAGHDTGLHVVASGVASELKDFSSQVLKHGGEIHGGTSSNAGSEAAALEESANAANGKLQTSLGAAAHALL